MYIAGAHLLSPVLFSYVTTTTLSEDYYSMGLMNSTKITLSAGSCQMQSGVRIDDDRCTQHVLIAGAIKCDVMCGKV